MKSNRIELNDMLNLVISVLLAIVPFFIYSYGHSNAGSNELFFESLFFWYLGLIFVFSARYAKNLFVFGLIDYVFSKTSVVGGKYRARIYGAISCVVGAIEAIRWLTY